MHLARDLDPTHDRERPEVQHELVHYQAVVLKQWGCIMTDTKTIREEDPRTSALTCTVSDVPMRGGST